MDIAKWIGITLGVFSTIVSIVIYVSYTRFRTEQLAKELTENKGDLKTLIKDFQGVTGQLAAITREQAIINVRVADTFASVMDKLEKITNILIKHGEEIAVLKDRADG